MLCFSESVEFGVLLDFQCVYTVVGVRNDGTAQHMLFLRLAVVIMNNDPSAALNHAASAAATAAVLHNRPGNRQVRSTITVH